MRSLMLCVALAGCLGGDPHEVVTCTAGDWTSGPPFAATVVTSCEAACESRPEPAVSDHTCRWVVDGLGLWCDAGVIVEHDGTRGCCVTTAGPVVRFFACE